MFMLAILTFPLLIPPALTPFDKLLDTEANMAGQPLLQESELSFDYHDDKEEDAKHPAWNANSSSGNRKNRLHLLSAFLVGLTAGLLLSTAFFLTSPRKPTTAACLQKTSQPSPIPRDLEITYHEQQFNGSFLKETIYRQDASPEVDAAWEELGADCKHLRTLVKM